MAELVGEKTDKKTTAGKDLYKTPDGDLVSEKSVTFKLFGMYVNAPSIIKGKQYTEEEIKQMVEDGQLKPTSMHKTLEEAISAAKERSDSLLDTDEQTKRTFKLGGLGKTDAAKKQLDAPEKPKSTTIGGFLDKYVLGPELQGKVNPTVGQVADVATDFIPGVSEAKDVTSLAKNVASGNLLGAGIDAASLALGVIPIGGDALRRALKASVQPTKTKKAYKLFVEREGKLYPLFVDAKTEVPQGQYIQAVFPKEAFTAPNGKKYVPSKGAERTKGEKAKGTGDEVAVPDQETRQKLIDAGYSVSASTDRFPHGKVFAVAARPGFHASQLPVATHIGPEDIKISLKEKNKLVKAGITKDAFKEKTFFYDKDGKIVGKPKRKNLSEEEIKKLKKVKIFYVKRRAEDHVFAEVEMPDDVDYQSYLQEIGKTDINDHVPVGGSYKYVDGQAGKGAATNDSDKWVVGGSLKVNKVLTRQETKNLQELEGVKDLPYRDEIEAILGRKLSEGGLLKEKDMQSGIDDYVIAKTNPTEMKEGGMAKQMSLFQEGGLEQDGGTVDPVSGNEVPVGSSQEEVRDDIDAKLSEGEFVFPADVVRYIGLEKLMQLRQEAKAGLKKMEAMGQMGNSEEATLPDDIPFSPEDIMVEDDDGNEGELEMQVGGVVPSNQQGVYYQPSQVGSQFNIAPQQGQAFQPMPITPMPQQQTGYMPSFVGQPMPPQQQYTGFQQFVPELQDYVNQTYVNEETGETLIIPHLNGKPIYPPPAGFVLQVEEAKEEEVIPETVPTATVTETYDKEGDSTSPENMAKAREDMNRSYDNMVKQIVENNPGISMEDIKTKIKAGEGTVKIFGTEINAPGFLFEEEQIDNAIDRMYSGPVTDYEPDIEEATKPKGTIIATDSGGKIIPVGTATSDPSIKAGTAKSINMTAEDNEAVRKAAEEAKIKAEAEAKEKKRRAVETARLKAMAEAEIKKQESEENRKKAREEEEKAFKDFKESQKKVSGYAPDFKKGGIASKPKKKTMKRGGLASK